MSTEQFQVEAKKWLEAAKDHRSKRPPYLTHLPTDAGGIEHSAAVDYSKTIAIRFSSLHQNL